MFVDLLRSTVPATVSFAVKCLAVVDKAGLLDDDEYVAGRAPALAGATRATPIAAIALATRVVARRPDLAAAVAAVVVLGLEHPHRDVQTAALATLRTLDAQGLVRDRLDLLEPSVRRLTADWLGDAQATPASPLLALPPAAFVSTVDETVAELGARILTGTGSGWDVEQFLAGLLNAADPATEVAPLTTQAKKVVTNPSTVGTLRRQIAKTVDAALGQPDPAPAVNQRAASLHGDILSGRLAEVVEILAGRRPRQVLLATPTDPAGWLNPVVFVSRLSTLDGDPPHHDLVAALLRLSIAGRDAARSAAAGITGELGDVVRYALGGPPGEIATRSWWVAAARTRAPFDDDPHVIAAGLPGAGAGTAARYTVRLVPHPYSFEERGRTRTLTWWRPWLDVAPASGTEYADQPTVVAAQEMPISTDEADWLTWAGTVWPHDPEPFFARVLYDPWDAASTYPSVTYCTTNILNVLATHPGRLGPMAAATLAAGLAAREVGYRTQAVDALTNLVPTRLSVELLAEAMAVMAPHCPANRWAAALRDAASTAPGAATTVVDLLARLLPRLPHDHNGVSGLLETLHEESLRTGHSPVGDELRACLADLKGGSKSAKVAKAILADMGGGS